MIIEQSDRVDLLVFTLPVRSAVFEPTDTMKWNPTNKADFVGDLFDDYMIELGLHRTVRRFDYPTELPREEWQAQVGIVPRDGWEIWQARYARVVINEAGR